MMNRFHLFLLIGLLLVTAISYPTFMYLANHPSILLGIERTQPSSLIRTGNEMLTAGNLQRAVESFERAHKKYEALYEETGLERHRKLVADAAISVANAYRILGVTSEWQTSEIIYKEVLQDYPSGNHGSWILSRGMALEQLQRYDEAIELFNQVMDVGSGITKLYTRYERGRSFLELGKLEQACDDLYWFIRSQRWELSEEQWLEFQRLENAENPKKYFILGFTYHALNNAEQALSNIQTYLLTNPDDRAGLYLLSSLLVEPFVQDSTTISLSEMMPPQAQNPYKLTGGLLNLYIANPGAYSLRLTLSVPPKQEPDEDDSSIEVPNVTVSCNSEEIQSFFVSSQDTAEYDISLSLMEGKNIVQIQTQSVGILDPLVIVHLHSIQLLPLK